MSELLLELFCEEIPARMQPRAASDLKRLICEAMTREELAYEHADAYVTPRRLTLMVAGLPARQSDVREERKGPRVGAPEQAIKGFLRGAGLKSIDECQIRDDKKGQFYIAITERKGRATEEVLAGIIPAVIGKFPWGKSMRWGSGSMRWVRPLHSVLCVFGPSEGNSRIIDFEIGGIKSSNTTNGHRFLAPDTIRVSHFADYEQKLQKAFVMLDTKARREHISEGAGKLAKAQGLEVIEDNALLGELAGLVEWPVPLLGRFDENFLDLPPQVLESSMRKHQKYFSLRSAETGNMSNHFIVISNMAAKDGGKAIIAGNERVLHARLSDARFFWDQDLKTPINLRTPELDAITFHAKLGSQGERVKRITALARDIAPFVNANEDEVEQAASLCKSDLVTQMVGEFPDLQGLIGRIYAEKACVKPYIAKAIEEHYKPQGPNDAIPADPISIAVALADKIDTLVGFWAIDEKPTGSKDPYALRRAALGVIRIVLENNINIHLDHIIMTSRDYHKDRIPLKINKADKVDNSVKSSIVAAFKVYYSSLLSFCSDRLKNYLRAKGARHDLIDAVFALDENANFLMIVRRVEALGAFLETEDGANLLAGVKRASNILRIEEKKDKRSYDGAPDASLFAQDEEKNLFARIGETADEARSAIEAENFERAMTAMARLRQPVDDFFDKVTVNADDPLLRENRLKLLAQIRAATREVADFSKISG